MPTIAVVGASSDRRKFGNKAVRAYADRGWEVYPINPKGGEIEGQTAYLSLDETPSGALDRVSLYVPPAVGLKMLPEIAARGCKELWLNPGTESAALIGEAQALGLNPIRGCSIVDIGVNPHTLSEE